MFYLNIFFSIKALKQCASNDFEKEIREEQKERRKLYEEKRAKHEEFMAKKSVFNK